MDQSHRKISLSVRHIVNPANHSTGLTEAQDGGSLGQLQKGQILPLFQLLVVKLIDEPDDIFQDYLRASFPGHPCPTRLGPKFVMVPCVSVTRSCSLRGG